MPSLGLGTVQFGRPYGIANRLGQTPEGEVLAILDRAEAAGIALLDTAPVYGEAEVVLGRIGAAERFPVVSKTPVFLDANPYLPGAVSKAADLSLARLGTDRLYGLLIHHPDDLRAPYGGAMFDELLALKAEGKVGKVGLSVYCRDDLDAFGRLAEVDLVQLPVNLLDQRLLQDGTLHRLAELGIEVHARSAFLQGLLLMDPATVPAFFDPIRPRLLRLHAESAAAGLTPAAAALGFLRQIREVGVVLIGVETVGQFEALLDAWNASPDLDWPAFAAGSLPQIDPRQWPPKA